MGIRFYSLAVVAVAATFLLACSKPKPSPKPVESPATFGNEHKTINEFIVGKWCPATGIDEETAKEFGVDPGSEIDVSQYWEFAADGTFIYTHTGSPDKIHGKWEVFDKGVALTYQKWNDEDLSAAHARYQKEAESGTPQAIAQEMGFDNTIKMTQTMNYLVVSEDMKGLTFTDPQAGSSTIDMFSMVSDTPLARVQ